jgi:ZIP family zinc transporter
LIVQGLLLSLFAGLATGVGGLIVLLIGDVSRKVINFVLGAVSGMMLAVSFVSLTPMAMELAGLNFASIGFALGSVTLLVADLAAPHMNISGRLDGVAVDPNKLRKGLVIALGIAIHNIPEGLAVASGFSVNPNLGLLVALVIGAHNIPEGVITAIPLREGGMSRLRTLFMTLLSGLTEPAAAAVALLVLQDVNIGVLALSSAFAAGAMVYIAADELIPEAHAHGKGHAAVLGLTIGVLAAFFLMSLI